MASLAYRIFKAVVLLVLTASIVFLWYHYAPTPAARELRLAIYLAAGILFCTTAAYPLAGLALLGFAAPVLSVIPLYYSSGYTYPILIFSGYGFIAGWLLNEIIFTCHIPRFRGQIWLSIFAAIILVSAVASLLRYFPAWARDIPDIMMQAVNVKDMTREAATRYILFDLANVMLGILVVFASFRIVRKYTWSAIHSEDIIIWALLAGGTCAAAMAIYQGVEDVRFCANNSYYWIRLKRVNGTCSDPNALGTLLGLCIAVSTMKILFAGSWKSAWAWTQRVLAVCGTMLFALGIWYSGSRSGLLAALLGIVGIVMVFLLTFDKFLRKFKVPVIIRGCILVGGIVLLAAGFYAIPWGINTLDKKLVVSSTSSSLARRIKRDIRKYRQKGGLKGVFNDPRRRRYWHYAGTMWKDQPVTGVGLGAYVIELRNYAKLRGQELRRVDNACNYYLHYSAELGTPGIAVLILFYSMLIAGFIRIGTRWYLLSRVQQHQVIALAVPFLIFMVILVFGVHTISHEVNILWAVFLGIVAVQEDRILGPPEAGKILPLAILAGVIMLIFSLYVWQTIRVNRGPLDSERRAAAVGIRGDFGWYQWERWKGVPFRHRWMGKKAITTVPRRTTRIGIPIISTDPTISNKPQTVSFFVNGVKKREFILKTPGKWELITLPVDYADPFQKHVEPYTAIRIEVTRTWVPLQTTGEKDIRDLGIVVGEFRWMPPAKKMGGWHKLEQWEDTIPFRWSTQYAWREIAVSTNNTMEIPMYASNVLLRRWPLDVALYFNGEYLDTVTFRHKRWKNYRYPLPESVKPGSTNIIEFITSRTWVPKHYGFDDPRELGIAVGEITLK